MCPMAHCNIKWRGDNGISFIDSTSLTDGDASPIEEFKPIVCHQMKCNVNIMCSQLEQH